MDKISISKDLTVGRVHNSKKTFQYIAALAASLSAVATGTVLGWSAPTGPKIQKDNQTSYGFVISTTQQDWISSLPNVGAAAMCVPIGVILDWLGRRKTMLFLVIPFTIGWFLMIWATDPIMIMAGRFITGMAGGASCVTAPTYTTEIAEVSIRGALGSYYQLMLTIGILFTYIVGPYTSVYLFNILCCLIPIIFGVVFYFMPESPSFLVLKGRNDEARQALRTLRGTSYNVDFELRCLKKEAEDFKGNPISFLSSITKKSSIKAIVISLVLMLFQQLSGIKAIIFFSQTIFSSASTSIDAAVAAIVIGLVQVVCTFISSLIVDKLGRRILLLFSTLVTCLTLAALGFFFFLLDTHGSESVIVTSISWLPLVAISLYITAYAIGLGPIPWIISGELCLIDIKAFVNSITGTLNWVVSFVVTQLFNMLIIKIGQGQVFWLFAGIMGMAFFFVLFFVPETKGKSSEEIQYILGKEKHLRPHISIQNNYCVGFA